MNRQIKGALLALTGGACWGLSGSMGQYLFDVQGMDSRWLVPIRLFLAGVVMYLFCLFHYGKKTVFVPWRDRGTALKLIVYAVPGVAFSQFFYFLTIQLSSAGIGTIMQDLSPVMILLCACRIAKRRPRPAEVASLMLAILGVFLLTTHGSLDHLAVPAPAIASGILSAVAVTVYNVVPGKMLQQYPVALLQGWAFLMGGTVMAVLFRPWSIPYSPNLTGCLGIAFVVLVGNVLAFTCYMAGVSMIGPEKATLYGFAEPITAAVVTTLCLGSPFGWMDALGFLLIFAMLLLLFVSSLRSRHAKERLSNPDFDGIP